MKASSASMELAAPKKNLLRLLTRCQGVADKKSTMPVLANVLLTAAGDELVLAATDLYLSVTGPLKAEVTQPGSIAVPARDIYERVKAMPDGPVQISVKEGTTTIIKAVGLPRRYTLHGLPGSEFPALPTPAEDAERIELSVEALGQLIARTHFSVSTDETRFHLNSALFECGDGRVRMVTTDGHRLSKMDIVVPGLEAETSMLIPLKAIMELKRLTDEVTTDRSETKITISQTGPNAFFELGGVRISVKLVDAQFPPYDAVIPATSERTLRTPRLQLSDALRAVALAANDRTGGIKLGVANNVLKITSESPESGNGFDELSIDYEGPEISIGFNAKYILDILGAIDDEEVTLGLSGELDPAVVRPVSPKSDDDYIAVVMPMRI